jgi:hypothetical protein
VNLVGSSGRKVVKDNESELNRSQEESPPGQSERQRIEVISSPLLSIGTVIKTPDDGHWQKFFPQQQSDSHLVAPFQKIGVSCKPFNAIENCNMPAIYVTSGQTDIQPKFNPQKPFSQDQDVV